MVATEEYIGEDIKAHEQLRWGKAVHNIPRFAGAIRACQTLADRGEPVTRKAVRLMMGGGSDRDYAPIVQLFNERRAVLERFDETPGTLTMLIMESVNAAFKEHNRQYQKLMDQEADAFAQALAASSAEIQQLEAENKHQADTLKAQDETIAELKAALAASRQAVDKLNAEKQQSSEAHQVTLTEKDQAEKQLVEAKQAMQLLKQEHAQAFVQQAEAHQQRIKELKQANEREIGRLMQLLDAQAELQTQVKGLTAQVEAAEQGRAELKALLLDIQNKPSIEPQQLKALLTEIMDKQSTE